MLISKHSNRIQQATNPLNLPSSLTHKSQAPILPTFTVRGLEAIDIAPLNCSAQYSAFTVLQKIWREITPFAVVERLLSYLSTGTGNHCTSMNHHLKIKNKQTNQPRCSVLRWSFAIFHDHEVFCQDISHVPPFLRVESLYDLTISNRPSMALPAERYQISISEKADSEPHDVDRSVAVDEQYISVKEE